MKKTLYYTCRHCATVNSITGFWRWLRTPHFGSKKYLKCKSCGKYHAMERVGWTGPSWLDLY